jgi:cell wall-associated NlpC family hydrolase
MINRPRMLLVISACGALSLARGSDTVSSSSSSPASSSTTSASSDSTASESIHTSSYRVDKGDTLGSVAHQFHCSIATLRKLNDIHSRHLKPGTILEVPSSRHEIASKKSHDKPMRLAADKTSTTLHHHHTPAAQPVQDFDVSPSTFASCPMPAGTENEDSIQPTVISSDAQITSATPTGPTTTVTEFPPSLEAKDHQASLLPVPQVAPTPVTDATSTENRAFTAEQSTVPSSTGRPSTNTVLATPTQTRSSFANAIANFFGGSHTSESGEWGNRFLSEARDLAGHGIGYDESWRPDGESHSWEMDCSNTTRYLYRVTAGIELPRTASDQYYYLHLQDKAWDVPMTSRGFADCNYLRSNLKPGDLLFWENTYKPERQPPITHVMIYLGTDSSGRWLMAGSQSGRHGLYNPHRNGPDVYVFNPTQYSGGYTSWLGLVHHHGRFVAYGRPLEADVKKLSVAEND